MTNVGHGTPSSPDGGVFNPTRRPSASIWPRVPPTSVILSGTRVAHSKPRAALRGEKIVGRRVPAKPPISAAAAAQYISKRYPICKPTRRCYLLGHLIQNRPGHLGLADRVGDADPPLEDG